MKAAIINAYGLADCIEVVDIADPVCAPDQVSVRVHAAAVNPKDVFIRKGRFKRLTGSKFPITLGFDFAGEIADVGSKIKSFQKGDPVYGMLNGWHGGSCAEYVVANPGQIALKPKALSYEEAVALPLASLTALQALRDEAGIQAGHQVCINGASGGVGTMAIQIGKLYGAHVTAISRKENHDFLLDLGTDNCVDYRDTNITEGRQQFEIFFDVFGNRRFSEINPILKPGGVWVSTVIKSHVFISVLLTSFIGRKKAKLVAVKGRKNDLDTIREFVETGRLKPIIHEVFPLEEIRDAHAQQETKHTRGKIIISIGG